MLDETYEDLDQIIEFLHELRKLDPKKDDKLKALTRLLKRITTHNSSYQCVMRLWRCPRITTFSIA